MKLLVVEDNEDNRRLVIKRLRASGWTVYEATQATDALDLLQREKVDLVLLDIQLPGMNGLELVRIFKADPSLDSTVIVACSAFAFASDRERALEAGCHAYLSKPVDIRKLPAQLMEILQQFRPRG